MRSIIIIHLLTLGLLIYAQQNQILGTTKNAPVPPIRIFSKEVFHSYQKKIMSSFKRREYAHILLSFITGDKGRISPYTKRAFKETSLIFLLGFSGLHLSAIFLIFYKLKKYFKSRPLKLTSTFIFYIFLFYLLIPSHLKRLLIFRFTLFISSFLNVRKKQFIVHIAFYGAFLISIIWGDFLELPLGFIFSFIFLGTFLFLGQKSKPVLILGLFSAHLLINIFVGNYTSILAVPIGLIGATIYLLLFPLFLIFISSFWLISYNWIESLLFLFVKYVHLSAKLVKGTFHSSSIALYLLTLIVMWVMEHGPSEKRFAKILKFIIFVLILLHCEALQSPELWR